MLFTCCAIVSCSLYGLYRLASATPKLFRTAKFFRRVIIAGFVWNKQSSTASVSSTFFCRSQPTSAFRRKVPVPIFRLCRPGLTRSVAEHKNVDSVNEWNWRFLFPSWRSSRRVLFYAPPLHSSSDSVVRKNADWILDFTYERERERESFSVPHFSVRVRTLFWFICAIFWNIIINWSVIISRDKLASLQVLRPFICCDNRSNMFYISINTDYKTYEEINIYVLRAPFVK